MKTIQEGLSKTSTAFKELVAQLLQRSALLAY